MEKSKNTFVIHVYGRKMTKIQRDRCKLLHHQIKRQQNVTQIMKEERERDIGRKEGEILVQPSDIIFKEDHFFKEKETRVKKKRETKI
ncbi:hypothetical protein T10_11234 [Trichinella papuae]|uniref:Uncharacterized protein n=1 Tax=Trichinella papuae TaxID=268474 RepID=A0A0V1MHA1_9BILA|nr:hypothetical protein T10_11234 [Trichinella papuae]